MGRAVFKGEYPRISVKVVSCRMEVAVDWPGSPLLCCCPVVMEAVTDGFSLPYVYFEAFLAYDGIDEVGARAGEFVCELEGLFCEM